MRCVGGACDGVDFLDWPIDRTCWPPVPVTYAKVFDRGALPPLSFDPGGPPVRDQAIFTYEYKAVRICWPDGSTKTWVAVPAGLTEREVQNLLLEREVVDG